MPRKRKLSNINERCRICLTDNGSMSNLFSDNIEPKIKDLTKCTSIDIKREEKYPEIICHVCLYKLEMWHEFKEQFLESNKLLLNCLGYSELPEHAPKKQRTETQRSEDSVSGVSKKSNFETVGSTNENTDIVDLSNDIPISDEPVSSKDSPQKTFDVSNGTATKDDDNEKEESFPEKSPVAITKSKGLMGRVRKDERRRESMKRWVARKKALLAASGGHISDSDSIASDDVKLSPVQKARAKCNADKETEKQKRLAKALKMLETNMAGKYKLNTGSVILSDTDTDGRKTRSQKTPVKNISRINNKKSVFKENTKDSVNKINTQNVIETGKENSLDLINENNNAQEDVENDKIQNLDESFTPHSVKSQVQIGDATYIVTSTLVIAEPQYLNNVQLHSLQTDCRVLSIDDNSQEKNTDIIDAVQLRRVNPVSSNSSDKKPMESCLNIEVEGTELETLKKVQLGLAGFVETEMKDRLFGTSKESKSFTAKNTRKSSYQTLDQQLKAIVEKAIRKNYENFVKRDFEDLESILCNKSGGTISSIFVKTITNSKKFQPKVVLKRLNIKDESKIYKINNPDALERRYTNLLSFRPVTTLHKRQSVPPKKYDDYNVSIVDSDSDLTEDEDRVIPVPPRNTTARKSFGSTKRKVQESNKQNDDKNMEMESTNTTINNVTSQPSEFVVTDEQTTENESQTPKTVIDALPEKHICGICTRTFSSRSEVDAHVLSHKTENSSQRSGKQKVMRCKRCHEIVEARLVKAHVCRSLRPVHKCYVCNSTFRTEKLLVSHLENHDQSEFKIEHISKADSKKSDDNTSQNMENAAQLLKLNKSQNKDTNLEGTEQVEAVNTEKTQSEQKDNTQTVVEKPKETYTCFVCDKIFTDEDILKDHLQKHCEDISEDEQSTGKEQFQCAICGETQESGDALELHVEKHLYDDEDDNPDLINISSESEKSKEDSYKCSQCPEAFGSEMLLEMHVQAHEEEAAIAEWEKQGLKSYDNQCMICDEFFETGEELSEHLDVHNANSYVCQLCDKPFLTLEDLQNHVSTH